MFFLTTYMKCTRNAFLVMITLILLACTRLRRDTFGSVALVGYCIFYIWATKQTQMSPAASIVNKAYRTLKILARVISLLHW